MLFGVTDSVMAVPLTILLATALGSGFEEIVVLFDVALQLPFTDTSALYVPVWVAV
jgi:hypothetical protein